MTSITASRESTHRRELGHELLVVSRHYRELRSVALLDILRATVPPWINRLATVGCEPDEVCLPAVVCHDHEFDIHSDATAQKK